MNGLRLMAPWLPLFIVLTGSMAYGRSVHYIYSDDYFHNLWLLFFPAIAFATSALALFVPVKGKTIRCHIGSPRNTNLARTLLLTIAFSGFLTFWLMLSIPTIADLLGRSSVKESAQVVSIKASGGVLIDIGVIFESGESASIRQHKGSLLRKHDLLCATIRTSSTGRVVESLERESCQK